MKLKDNNIYQLINYYIIIKIIFKNTWKNTKNNVQQSTSSIKKNQICEEIGKRKRKNWINKKIKNKDLVFNI